jgi:hypothetical protein
MTKTWMMLCLTGLLALASVSCGSIDPGTTCHANDDCDDGQACVPIAFGCIDVKECSSTCEVTCTSTDDCSGKQVCENRNGHHICVDEDPEQPFE